MHASDSANAASPLRSVPSELVVLCHAHINAIKTFLPACNPQITSDAKVGVHMLAGAARAAYQTVLVNSPSTEQRDVLRALLLEIRAVEDELLE